MTGMQWVGGLVTGDRVVEVSEAHIKKDLKVYWGFRFYSKCNEKPLNTLKVEEWDEFIFLKIIRLLYRQLAKYGIRETIGIMLAVR